MPNEQTPNLIQWLTGGGAVALLLEIARRRWTRQDAQWTRVESELARKTAENEKNAALVIDLREGLFELQKSHTPQKIENSLLRTNRKDAADMLDRALKLRISDPPEALRLVREAHALLQKNIVVSRGD